MSQLMTLDSRLAGERLKLDKSDREALDQYEKKIRKSVADSFLSLVPLIRSISPDTGTVGV